jgi:hypothetical protein
MHKGSKHFGLTRPVTQALGRRVEAEAAGATCSDMLFLRVLPVVHGRKAELCVIVFFCVVFLPSAVLRTYHTARKGQVGCASARVCVCVYA